MGGYEAAWRLTCLLAFAARVAVAIFLLASLVVFGMLCGVALVVADFPAISFKLSMLITLCLMALNAAIYGITEVIR